MAGPALLLLLLSIAVPASYAKGGHYCNQDAMTHMDVMRTTHHVYGVYKPNDTVTGNMNCEFATSSDGKPSAYVYYIEIPSDDVVPDYSFLEILDGLRDRPLLRQSIPDRRYQVLVSQTDKIHIKFTTTASYPMKSNRSTGYHIRLTSFKGCPNNWTQLGHHCFSNSSVHFMKEPEVDFYTAQSICNRMRADLLVLNCSGGTKNATELIQELQFTDPVWINLTNTENINTNWLSCRSDETKSHISDCESTERFAYLRPTTSGFLVLDRQESLHQFACYGHASRFQPTIQTKRVAAPDQSDGLIVIILAAFAFACLLLAVVFVVCLLRRRGSSHAYARVNASETVGDEALHHDRPAARCNVNPTILNTPDMNITEGN